MRVFCDGPNGQDVQGIAHWNLWYYSSTFLQKLMKTTTLLTPYS